MRMSHCYCFCAGFSSSATTSECLCGCCWGLQFLAKKNQYGSGAKRIRILIAQCHCMLLNSLCHLLHKKCSFTLYQLVLSLPLCRSFAFQFLFLLFFSALHHQKQMRSHDNVKCNHSKLKDSKWNFHSLFICFFASVFNRIFDLLISAFAQ